jgi:hypothetical protein
MGSSEIGSLLIFLLIIYYKGVKFGFEFWKYAEKSFWG